MLEKFMVLLMVALFQRYGCNGETINCAEQQWSPFDQRLYLFANRFVYMEVLSQRYPKWKQRKACIKYITNMTI